MPRIRPRTAATRVHAPHAADPSYASASADNTASAARTTASDYPRHYNQPGEPAAVTMCMNHPEWAVDPDVAEWGPPLCTQYADSAELPSGRPGFLARALQTFLGDDLDARTGSDGAGSPLAPGHHLGAAG
jgi:hypothetical protein